LICATDFRTESRTRTRAIRNRDKNTVAYLLRARTAEPQKQPFLSNTRTHQWTAPCSPLKINRCFGGTYHFHLQGRKISQVKNQREAGSKQRSSYLAYSSTLKMEVTCSCERSFAFQRTIRHYIPEDRTLPNHRCENLKSYMSVVPSSRMSTCTSLPNRLL
jgi:hypothetical protein